jgi:hypothetical protein
MSCGLDEIRHRELNGTATVGGKAEASTPSDTHHPTDFVPKPQFTRDMIKKNTWRELRSRLCFSNRIQAKVMGFLVHCSKISCSVKVHHNPICYY